MPEFEPFEYGEGSGEGFEEEGAVGTIKSKLKLIIGIIVIAVIGFVVYSFLFAGFVEVNISVKDTEGTPIQARIKISSAGETVFNSKTPASNALTELKAGEYSVEVTKTGYISYRETKTVSGEEGEVWEIVLQKKFANDVEIVSIQAPAEIFAGQSVSGTVVLKNNGSTVIDVELLAETLAGRNLSGLNVEFSLPTITLSPGRDQSVSFTVTADEDIDTGRTGKEYQMQIRVKGTNNMKTKEGHAITAFPEPEIEITPRDIKLRADAGEETRKEIKIRNKGKVALKELNINVAITSASVNEIEEVRNWFSFTTTGNSTIEIDHIGTDYGENEATITLRADVPQTAKKESISGQLIISSEWLKEDVVKAIELEIQEEVEVKVSLRLPATEIEVSYSEEEGVYERINSKYLTIKNEGIIGIGMNATGTPISIQVKNPEICTTEWISGFSPPQIDDLPAGEDKKSWVEISAPTEAFIGEAQDVVCQIMVSYTNPLTEERDPAIVKSMHLVARQ